MLLKVNLLLNGLVQEDEVDILKHVRDDIITMRGLLGMHSLNGLSDAELNFDALQQSLLSLRLGIEKGLLNSCLNIR